MENQSYDILSGLPSLPYHLEAEQAVLGTILADPDRISTALEYLKPESFYNEQHRALFSILVQMFSQNSSTDIITVLNESIARNIFTSDDEAREYLKKIMDSVPTMAIGHFESYCKIIEDKFYLRSLIIAARNIIESAANGQEDAKTILDSAEQSIYDIRQGKESSGLTRLNEVILEAYDRLQKITGPDKEKYLGSKSGFSGLDAITSGLNNSDLIILAARPGMGKTSFALNIASNVASKNREKEVVVFSLEMGREQLATRMLSSESLVNSNSLRSGRLGQEEWTRLAGGADLLSRLNLYIDDTPGITVPQMKAKLRRMRNLGLVVIDYLQLMSSSRRIDNRVTEISEITRQLKLMAKELNVPIITLSQLSRGSESRTDKRPLLSDLRDSGSIEQDADIVLFLYRDGYYNKDGPDQSSCECIIAKNRHGETATVPLIWDGQFTRFSSAELTRTE